MLKLKKISFSGIGRFVEPQEIDFTNLGNIVQVDAFNSITNGSSGSGKSTIFNALEHLLGLSDLSLSVLQSRLTKDHLNVSGEFDWDGKQLTIKRAKKLSIIVDGTVIEGSSKISEEKLTEILGMPKDLFRQLLHRRQKEQGFFLNLKPAEMNSFLVDVLGLSSISSKIDSVDLKIKELSGAKTTKQIDLQASQAALNATKEAIRTLGEEPTAHISEDQIKASDDLVKQSEANLQSIVNKHKSELDGFNLSRPNFSTIPFDKTQTDSLELQIKTLNDQISKLQSLEKDRQTEVSVQISSLKLDSYTKISYIREEFNKKETASKNKLSELNRTQELAKFSKEKAVDILAQINTIKSGICHTCEQSWVTDKAKNEEARLLLELAKYKENIQAGIDANNQACILKCIINDETLGYGTQINEITGQTTAKMLELGELLKPQITQELVGLKSVIEDLNNKKEEEKEKENTHNSIQHVQNQKLLQSFLSKQKELLSVHEAEINDIRKELDEEKKKYEQATSQFNTHKTLFVDYKRNTEALKVKELAITQKLADIAQDLVDLEEKLQLADEIKRCLKLYLSCSFDDALDSISNTATKILRSIPTMAMATIRLEGQKETGSGAIKEQVTAYIDNEGELEVPIKSLSGGERSALDLAIDLAVSEIIRETANKGIDLMCLDEVFGGFDSIGIEQALEMLKTFSQETRLLIVEHNDVSKEFISQKVTVIRTGETSSIKIA